MEYVIFAACIFAVIILAKLFAWPLKIIFKLVLNIVLGVPVLYLVNIFGVNFCLLIPINWITALMTGVLGIPGVVLLLVFQFLV